MEVRNFVNIKAYMKAYLLANRIDHPIFQIKRNVYHEYAEISVLISFKIYDLVFPYSTKIINELKT
jgi:hypothetical protein